jgi:hypothetical protein
MGGCAQPSEWITKRLAEVAGAEPPSGPWCCPAGALEQLLARYEASIAVAAAYDRAGFEVVIEDVIIGAPTIRFLKSVQRAPTARTGRSTAWPRCWSGIRRFSGAGSTPVT